MSFFSSRCVGKNSSAGIPISSVASQADVAEVEKVGGPVPVPVHRNQDAHERRVTKGEPKRELAGRRCHGDSPMRGLGRNASDFGGSMHHKSRHEKVDGACRTPLNTSASTTRAVPRAASLWNRCTSHALTSSTKVHRESDWRISDSAAAVAWLSRRVLKSAAFEKTSRPRGPFAGRIPHWEAP